MNPQSRSFGRNSLKDPQSAICYNPYVILRYPMYAGCRRRVPMKSHIKPIFYFLLRPLCAEVDHLATCLSNRISEPSVGYCSVFFLWGPKIHINTGIIQTMILVSPSCWALEPECEILMFMWSFVHFEPLSFHEIVNPRPKYMDPTQHD